MKLVSVAKEAWTPDWNGNLKLPKAEQVAIHLTYPTIEEKEGVSNIEYVKGKSGDIHGFKIIYDTAYLLKNHVPKIENLVHEVDGKEKNIKSGEELLQATHKSLQSLVQMIVSRLTMADEVVNEKN